MIRESRTVRWVPDHAGKRMEDWLNNMGDWCISRKRFWGLPLPFFKCSCSEITIVGSRKQLEDLAVSGMDDLPELHRPWIDNVKIRCPQCGGTAERVPEVGDCWLDAGIVPFSTLGYLDEDNSYWRKWFPADFVCEMREQIRLWFYAMMFMSVTLTGKSPYRAALVYEKVHDEQGRPMHKSWGNAIWFDDAVEKMGADVMRWVYASANIQTNLNFGYGIGHEVVRKLLTLWNTYSFFVMYANVDGWTPDQTASDRPTAELDRWILSRLHSLVGDATSALERFDTAHMTQAVETFIDDLSNWYVRLSRRRFWRGESDEDKQSAYATLYEVLVTLTRLIAPVLPLTAEEMYQNLVRSARADALESVHLCDWPTQDKSYVDERLMTETESVMRVVRLGRAARNAAGIKVRQPLAALYVRMAADSEREAVKRNERLILDELNVKALAEIPSEGAPESAAFAEEDGILVAFETALSDELVQEGLARDFIRRIQNLRKESGFNVDERIIIRYEATEKLALAISAYADYIKQETLTDNLTSVQSDCSFVIVKIGCEEAKLVLEHA
jgi:isoleucyl-tRNA synthetase